MAERVGDIIVTAAIVISLLSFVSILLGESMIRGDREKKRSKVLIASATLICSIVIVVGNQYTAKKNSREQSELHAAIKKRADEAGRTASLAAQEKAAAALKLNEIAQSCLKTLEGEQTTASYLQLLPQSTRDALHVGGVPNAPRLRPGGAQIRIITASSREEAIDRLKHLRAVLKQQPGNNWASHLTDPVDSIPSVGKKRGNQIFPVTLNQVEAIQKDSICHWLEDVGVLPGVESCDIRNMNAALGKLGRWPAPIQAK